MVLRKLLRRSVVLALYAPPSLHAFFSRDCGAEYGVGIAAKFGLFVASLRNSTNPGSGTTFLEQLALARGVLSIPSDTEGAVAEFGCFKGLSTATLSRACRLAGRQLIVFDSFGGLPEPLESVTHIATGEVLEYSEGDWAGSLDEVRRNVERHGAPEVCEFVQGYFEETLPHRPERERYALVFEDADLPSSVTTVLRWAWPRLQPGCVFFTHEARDMEVVRLFFDDGLWQESIGHNAPGLVGSGRGLPFGPNGSCLAYTVRRRET